MPEKMRIIFVDDVSNILDALRRMLRPVCREWEMSFANGGAEAMECLDGKRYDVIVSDMRMPGMSGAELLENVRRKHPHMIRIALSGQADRETVLEAVGPTHQYLSKPCNLETLKAVLDRVISLRKLLGAEKLVELVSAMEFVPSLPRLYKELTDELLRPNASIESVARTIASDVGMSAKVLQLVSSGFFGQPKQVSGAGEAVEALGMDIIKPLTLSLNLFSPLDATEVEDFSMEALWRHSANVAFCAGQIAQSTGADSKTVNAACLAGMLHDVGKIIFADRFTDDYRSAMNLAEAEGIDPLEAEAKTIGATHAGIGAYLLGIWAFPDPIVEAVAYHHFPSKGRKADGFAALTAVHVADAVEGAGPVDMEYLAGLGLADRLDAWREICLENTKETANA